MSTAIFRAALLGLAARPLGTQSEHDILAAMPGFGELGACALRRNIFALGNDGTIQGFACDDHHTLIPLLSKGNIRERLAPESLPAWDALESQRNGEHLHPWISLSFRDRHSRIVPSASRLFRLLPNGPLVLYSVFEPIDEAAPQQRLVYLPERIKEFIDSRLDSHLPVLKDLAHDFGTNEHTLNDVFREAYGMPIYRYFTGRRLDHAMTLIKESNLPLKTIAAMSGYHTYSVFSKAFRRRFGTSASGIARNFGPGPT